MGLIQPGPFIIHDGKAFPMLLNTHPSLGHAVEVAADAPFHGGPLHAVAEPALDGLKIAVIGAVPFGQPLLLLAEVDGDAAQLGLALLPGHKLVLPAVDAHRVVQAVLDGPVGDIGDGQPLILVTGGHGNAPINVSVGERGAERLTQFFRRFLPHSYPPRSWMNFPRVQPLGMRMSV